MTDTYHVRDFVERIREERNERASLRRLVLRSGATGWTPGDDRAIPPVQKKKR